MLLLAHRGYHAGVPANTMAAFAAAVALSVDGIETDVRLSGDGKPVIVHDRVTSQMRAVAELTHRAIVYDAGHPAPLLAEALDAFPGVLWNIEIKAPEAVPVMLPLLKRNRDNRRLFVSSFRHDVVADVALQVAVDRGLLLAHRPLDAGAIIAGCAEHARIRSVIWDYNIVDAAALEAVAQAGWDNYVYGAMTLAGHRRCAALGLAGLITDYPLHVLSRQSKAGEGKNPHALQTICHSYSR